MGLVKNLNRGAVMPLNVKTYHDSELVLQVRNDEYFWLERYDQRYLLALVQEEFLYTPVQLLVLKKYLKRLSHENKI